MKTRIAALVLVLAAGCSRPWLVIPGGKLDGTVKPTPESFAFAKNGATIQLETRPQDPYSVNVSSAIVDGSLYVSGGDTKTRWVENMIADPEVRARVAGDVYELRARRVEDPAELRAFAAAWLARSTFARDPLKFPEVWVYRLEPR